MCTNSSERGFEIMAFPCGQFLDEEYHSLVEIKRFTSNLGVELLMFQKVNVKGKNAHDLYVYLRTNSNLREGNVDWNFGKLINWGRRLNTT